MKKPERTPAFQFYPDKWLGSAAVTMMDAAEEGTYIRLLAHQWKLHTAGEGKLLPANPDDLRRLTKLDARQWKAAWRRLAEHFPMEMDLDGGAILGRANPTMLAIWAERLAFIETQVARGAKGGRPKKETPEKPTALFRVPEMDPERPHPGPKPEPTANPDESSVVCSLESELPNLTDVRLGSSAKQPGPTAERPSPGILSFTQTQMAELQAAALPHEALALDILVQNLGPQAYAAIGEMHAIATGMHPIVGPVTGRIADATDVMRALAEMVGNGTKWNVSYYRGHVKRMANRAPEAPTTAEREAAKAARAVMDAARSLSTLPIPDTPEQAAKRARERDAAIAAFKAEFKRNNPDAPPPTRFTPETPS